MIHELKCWPQFYALLADHRKTFEIRLDDRGYAVYDILFEREWDPGTGFYTGRQCKLRVTHLMRHADFPAIPLGYVIMSVRDAAL